MKSYKAKEWRRAERAWIDGEFSDEWTPWKQYARTHGTILFPPEGTRWDSWEDEAPSQRAMLIRAIRETPDLLRRSIRGARSWGQVIERLIGERDRMREQILSPESKADPTTEEATEILRAIIRRIGT